MISHFTLVKFFDEIKILTKTQVLPMGGSSIEIMPIFIVRCKYNCVIISQLLIPERGELFFSNDNLQLGESFTD